MPKFNDRVFGSNVDESIIDIFENLQKGSFQLEALEQAQPEYQDYLGDRTTFARMWTAILVEDNNQQRIIYHILNDNRDESYKNNITDPLGDNVINELTSNNLLKPKAGITSLSSKTEGALGAVKRTTVEFVVHNKNDFENIFLPFFLKPGASVVIDFGWSDRNVELYDVTKVIEDDDVELRGLKEFLFGGKGGELQTGPDGEEIIKSSANKYFYKEKATGNAVIVPKPKQTGFINDYKGKVECMVGRVVDYTTNVNQQGSFECSLTVVSDNTSLLDAEISTENKLKFIFANKMEQIIVSALSAVKKEGEDKGEVLVGNSLLSTYDRLSSEDKKEVLDGFFKQVELSSKKYLIATDSLSLRNGIFHQNIISQTGARNKKDMLYIAYGLFEDLFLNGIIAQNTDQDKIHEVNYNSQDTVVRYNSSLVSRQTAKLRPNEALPVFMYPETWESTYNTQDLPEKINKDYESQLSGDNQYDTPIIPFRDLFISVPMIGKKFAQKQNVNDALISILEEINSDSYGVFKLKMIALNDSFSSIGIVDANLINVPEDDTTQKVLKFDITSDKSIVYNLDYKFGMPKGGLASMIAIGEKGDFAFFDDQNIDNLNFTQILGPNKDIFGDDTSFKSLPLVKKQDEQSERLKKTAYDFSEKTIKKFTSVRKKFGGAYFKTPSGVKNDWVHLVRRVKKKKDDTESNNQNTSNNVVNKADEKPIKSEMLANTPRDGYGKDARISVVLGSTNTSVSPILPIELSLTIYGNSYLNIGDLFSINFLPKYYTQRVIFQIVGVEQKLGTNWETTYSTVMRLNPIFKKEVATSFDGMSEEEKEKLEDTLEKGTGLELHGIQDIINDHKNSNSQFLFNAVVSAKDFELKSSTKPQVSVTKVRVKYDSSIGKLDSEEIRVSKEKGNSRVIYNEFSPPKSIGTGAWFYTIQASIGYAIEQGLSFKTNEVEVQSSFELTDDEFNLKGKQKKKVFLKAYYEKNGNWSDDAIIDFFPTFKDADATLEMDWKSQRKNLDFIERKIKAVIKRLNEQKQVKSFYSFVKDNMDKTKAGQIEEENGVLVPHISFSWTNKDESGVEDGDERYVYIIDVERRGNHRIILPDWFFAESKLSVDTFCEKLLEYQEEFISDYIKLG